ncbi:MAG: DUF1080 domain-containing protein [Proteobacteria bacterium]|jgi:hypothetical protein|nr:DUF1080 domain-containing protein [Pseudomonadota bacterium]
MNRKLLNPIIFAAITLTASVSFSQTADLIAQAMEASLGTTGANYFTYENGELTSVRAEDRSFLVIAEPYDNFELSIEYWVEPSTNSGIFVRCQDLNEVAAGTCYEVNIWDENENPANRTGAIINFAPPLVEIDSQGQWNTMNVRADGGHLVVIVNGQTTVDTMDDTYTGGHIALQYGGDNMLVKFRNLEIEAL